VRVAIFRGLVFGSLCFFVPTSESFAEESGNSHAKAVKCIEDGKRLDSLANIENIKSQKQFEQALEKYLCAARAGSAEGALLATSLSLSGMAPRLSDDSLRTLYQLAIDSGRLEGYSGMAELACGPEGFSACTKDPRGAIEWLFKGGRQTFQSDIAEILRDPNIPISDSAIAYGCMKGLRGKWIAELRSGMLKASPRLDTSRPCEPKP